MGFAHYKYKFAFKNMCTEQLRNLCNLKQAKKILIANLSEAE